MQRGTGRVPARPLGAGPVVLLGAAFAYATFEFLWQAYVSPPDPSLPGGTGASWPMMAALAASVIVLPGMVARLLLWKCRSVGATATVLAAGLVPTTVVALDHWSQTHEWAWMGAAQGGFSHGIRLLAASFLLGLTLAGSAAWVCRRWQGPRWSLETAVVVALVSPPAFWALRPVPEQMIPASEMTTVRPNVLILTIDTLRQDALGAYGGPPAATLDSLIATGTRFDGWSVASWTRPSMASFFSAVAPTGTGVDRDHAMREDLRTWVQRLEEEGYVTAAVTANPHLRARFGFDRGFGYFDHADHVEWLSPVIRSFWGIWLQRQLVERWESDRADHVVDRVRYWWEKRRPKDRPWLLWVHFMDPHLPYHLRGPRGEKDPPEEPEWLADLGSEFQDGFFRDLPAVREGRALQSETARKALRQLYQREVLFADRQIGKMLRWMRSSKATSDLVWVLTSDHGEEFWDDGGYEHGHTLHRSVLRVPLALGGAGLFAAGERGGTMRLSDVGPTLLASLGVEGFDPSAGALVEDFDDTLRAMVLGQDLQALPEMAGSSSCSWPQLLAEGMFYGPPQTRLVRVDGLDLLRRDDDQQVVRRWRCDGQGLP